MASDVIDLQAVLNDAIFKHRLLCVRCGVLGPGFEILEFPVALVELVHGLPTGHALGNRLVPLISATCKGCGDVRFINATKYLKQKP